MKTAMQIVSERIESAKDNFPGVGFNDEFMRGFNKAFQISLLICNKVGLETEKQQIIDAHDSGQHLGDSEQYYNETFETKKETLK